MTPTRIDVSAGSHRYPIYIQEGLRRQLAQLVEAARLGPRQFIVSSPLVWKLHGGEIGRALPRAESILVPDGERFKHLQTVARIYEALILAHADRGAAMIAVGGGVLGDMAGFAAATFLRGINLVHVPTTLLAQVDSSIGGKVGINHSLGKNLIGAFHHPAFVAIDPQVLSTLPRREFRAGIYEIVKYGMTSSQDLFDRVGRDMDAIFAREPDVLVPVIAEACAIKAAVVAQDEREAGPRRVLNFGHTVGHALEAITKYRRFRHGEAIAYGMLAAAEIAVARGAMFDAERQALSRMIVQLGPLPPVGDLSIRETLAAIRHDKKIIDGTLHFVLATAVGAWTIATDVTENELVRALRKVGLKR